MTKQPDERKALLFSAVLSLKTPEECENFSVISAQNRASRDDQAPLGGKAHTRGKKYSEIVEETGLSTATITRVNGSLRDGSEGYMTVLSRILKNTEEGK